MKYFSIEELCASTTAATRNINNTPNAEQEANIVILIDRLLDPIRERWGAPITVNSGFRSVELNKYVGGVATSQHTKGLAADITAGSKAENKDLYEMILNMGIEFDQLIDENDYTWIHISYNKDNNRMQAFKL